MPSDEAPAGGTFLMRIVAAERREIPAVIAGFLLFFLLFSGYFMLRPVRETMGIAGGVDNLQWLFLGTFLATLAVVPFYGALSARIPRRLLLPATYIFFAATKAGFGAAMLAEPANVWVGRAFYIWLSVYNLFVISIAWSLMTDVFRPGQAKRLFAQIAAGASLGGLTGPLLSGALVARVGHAGLLFISAALLIASLMAVGFLLRWRAANNPEQRAEEDPSRAIGGSMVAGLTLTLRSPYLLAVSLFVVLLASVTTFLYFEQARLVEATFPDPIRQTQVFSAIDAAVQALTILIQLFVTGQLAKRLGVTLLLTAVPVAMTIGFGALALAATFPVLVIVMMIRRVGEYALARPGREMLFTTVDPETKYKAKNAIDTVVYRGGDAISAWVKAGIDAISTGATAAALAGVGLAALWGATGYYLGRTHDRRST